MLTRAKEFVPFQMKIFDVCGENGEMGEQYVGQVVVAEVYCGSLAEVLHHVFF